MDLAHVALCVSDLDRAMEFYGELGFEETNRFTVDGVENVYLAEDGEGDGDIQLRHEPDRTTPIAPTRADVDHVAFTVDDVDATFEQALDAGAAPVLEPTESEGTDAYISFVEDPDGYTLEILSQG
ncbi:VOC family protein [Halomicroarcula sp. GCM10025324]|uniref:VOC family protein n=1 Tax=Haloarcula TaxID=2237 RepID=UPI0023E8DC41|nr:VOC family protein [Halomicroarcula sp. ZS-22-S1]